MGHPAKCLPYHAEGSYFVWNKQTKKPNQKTNQSTNQANKKPKKTNQKNPKTKFKKHCDSFHILSLYGYRNKKNLVSDISFLKLLIFSI